MGEATRGGRLAGESVVGLRNYRTLVSAAAGWATANRDVVGVSILSDTQPPNDRAVLHVDVAIVHGGRRASFRVSVDQYDLMREARERLARERTVAQ